MKPGTTPGTALDSGGLNLADDVRRELQRQMTMLAATGQLAMLPVIVLVVSGLWGEVAGIPLLCWGGLALVTAAVTFANNRRNQHLLSLSSLPVPGFVSRNAANYFLVGFTWGSLPLCCALFGDQQASWFGLVIAMAVVAALVLVLSNSHRVFLATMLPAGSLTMAALAIGPLPAIEMSLLASIYIVTMVVMHNMLFHMQVERVRATLHNAAQASMLARTLEHHDPLTGLYNRAGLNAWLEQQQSVDRDNHRILLAMGNVIGFTELNTLYGSSIADGILREIAARLVNETKGKVCVARLGGAEFTLVDVRPFTTPGDLQRMLGAVENEAFQIDGQTVAIGVRQVWLKGGARELGTLIEHARANLQSLRADDGNSEQLAGLSFEHRRSLINSFHQALAQQQIQPWFQPIIDCRTKAITGWEALARWEHPTHGEIAPDSFLVIARVSRQLALLTRIMLRTSARFVRELEKLGLGHCAHVHVNITASELGNPSTLEWMETILTEEGVEPGRITIELSEKDAPVIDDQLRRNLERMQEIGMQLAIDDFGTGYSNLGQLLDLPANAVKIDKRFIDKLPHDKDSAALVRAVITLASGLDMQAIAEGVEEDVQLEFLCANDCDAYQGFHGGKAMPYTVALALAREWQPR